MSAYLLNRGNKSLSHTYKNHTYVIGFKSAITARKVHYSIHPEPQFMLLEGETHIDTRIDGIKISIDTTATLFIPKCKGSTLLPLNDGGFHLNKIDMNNFVTYPIRRYLGIIIPYDIVEENDDEFIFKSQVIDPVFNSEWFSLDNNE
jgi:hypothetical protein